MNNNNRLFSTCRKKYVRRDISRQRHYFDQRKYSRLPDAARDIARPVGFGGIPMTIALLCQNSEMDSLVSLGKPPHRMEQRLHAREQKGPMPPQPLLQAGHAGERIACLRPALCKEPT
jgi:hypothetical protein